MTTFRQTKITLALTVALILTAVLSWTVAHGQPEEGRYKNGKKEGIWIKKNQSFIEITEYKNGLKDGIFTRKNIQNQDTFVTLNKLYKNDTLIEASGFSGLSKDGGLTIGKFPGSWSYISNSRDTLFHFVYKPDSSGKLLYKGITTDFSLEDYLKFEMNFPPECLFKSRRETYHEKKGIYSYVWNNKVTRSILKIDKKRNETIELLYDSTEALISEYTNVSAWEEFWQGDDKDGSFYWFIDTSRIRLKHRCSNQYPCKIRRITYLGNKASMISSSNDFGNSVRFDTAMFFYENGNRKQILIETNANSFDTLFYLSKNILCYTVWTKGDKPSSIEKCHYENGAIQQVKVNSNGIESRSCYFENGTIRYEYKNDRTTNSEERKIFNRKGQIVCFFKRKGDIVTWFTYSDKGKKTKMISKKRSIGEGFEYTGCEFDEK